MEIFLFDSLSRTKREFQPINKKNIKIYACGPTVYNFAHIGNARMAVVCDLLVRVLKTKFSKVTFVSNITDIDDKIINAANSQKKSIEEITEYFYKIYNQDMNGIGVNNPDIQPKATEHISDMIEMIKKLILNGCAYEVERHVLFNVKKYKYYGNLSRRSDEEQIAGNRVEVLSFKKNPQDFVLWKPSSSNDPGWESPWGIGRPGWHIECSAMSETCLGIPFDIHCGGVDLTFPHHENEIAQSCSVNKINDDPRSFCNYWFHNGFVTVGGEKMAKSVGNITLVNDLLKKYSGDTIRLCLLISQYRQPLDWSEKILEQSKKTLRKFLRTLDDLNDLEVLSEESDSIFNFFLSALYDDLNTPKALAILNDWFNKIRSEDLKKKVIIKSAILRALDTLGLKEHLNEKRSVKDNKVEKKKIVEMINERELARKNNDFSKADKIRSSLRDLKIELEDTPEGTIWKKIE